VACNFWTDPKVIGSSPAVKLIVLASYTHVQEMLTDGLVRTADVPMIAAKAGVPATKKVVADIVQRGLWEPCEGGWVIPAWYRWNKPAEVVKIAKEAKKKAGILGNHNRWHVNEGVKVLACELCYPNRPRKPVADAIADAIGNGSQTDRHRTQTPTTSTRSGSVADPVDNNEPGSEVGDTPIDRDHPVAIDALRAMTASIEANDGCEVIELGNAS
jgi:hypothetical protein